MSSLDSVLIDPLDKNPIGDMAWFKSWTGWSTDKACRYARQGLIPGAFRPTRGVRGAQWSFRKAKTIAWIASLETK